MKKLILTAIMASAFIMTALPLLAHASSQQNSSAYWVNVYGALSEADHPLVSRIQEVFQRVLNAADKRGNRVPNLIILREIGNPWAFCLKDGSVLLSQKAAEFCYQDVEKSVGDARVAFVLGHELAHLSADDFWGMEAFQALENFKTDPKSATNVQDILSKTEDAGLRKTRELKADAYGLLYASMAGYPPRHVADTKGKNFFQHWADQITKQIAYTDDSHPGPKERAALLLSKMNAVREQVYLFQIGARLYQLGRYDDALDFLEVFQEEFPCREVFNNIGLIYYQKAMRELAECDRNRAYRFKLAIILDTETQAETFLKKCGEDLLRKAVRYFRHACERDTLYATARVNLSAALILSGTYSGAMSVLDEALMIQKDDPKALNNRAVAMYLLGPSIKTDMFQQASEVLKAVIEKHPEYSDAYYNLGRIQAERERNAALRETWGKYTDKEPIGIYSDIVRESLQTEKPPPGIGSAPSEFIEACPVKLGEVDDETEKHLAGFDEHTPDLRKTFGKYYVRDGVRVLVLEDMLEVVETPVTKAVSLSEIMSVYGQPRREHPAPSGVTTTLVYDNFALDIQDDMVRKVIHFVVPITPSQSKK